MGHCRLTDFDIMINGYGAPYQVHATYKGHGAGGEFAIDAAQAEWATRLEQLAAGAGPGQPFLEATGANLFRQLFQDGVRDLWVHAQSDLAGGAADGICVRLMTPPPAVAALPWEVLFDPDRKVAFAGSVQTPLVRVENLLRHIGHVRPLQARLPLRLLLATPDDPAGQLDTAGVRDRLMTALAPLAGSVVDVIPLDGRFSVVDLRDALAGERPDIVHLVTHGHADGVLLWQNGEPCYTPAASLRAVMDGADSVKLVLLSACSTGQGSLQHSLASVGAQLLQAGLPAVIAMQFDIEESTAADFSRFFYQELFSGRCPGAVHLAVNYARSNLYALDPASYGYGTPVLWLNAPNGAIFEMDGTFMPPLRAHPASAATKPPDLKPLIQQRRHIEQWRTGLDNLDVTALTPSLRPIQRPLQDALREVDALLVQLRGLEQEPPTEQVRKQYEEKLALILSKQHTVDRLAGIIREQQERRAGE